MKARGITKGVLVFRLQVFFDPWLTNESTVFALMALAGNIQHVGDSGRFIGDPSQWKEMTFHVDEPEILPKVLKIRGVARAVLQRV